MRTINLLGGTAAGMLTLVLRLAWLAWIVTTVTRFMWKAVMR